MKNLRNFLFEQLIKESDESKTVSFEFKGLDGGEDALKKFTDKDSCEISDTKLTVTVTKDNANKISDVYDELNQFCQGIRNSTKRASDEQYAQKTKSFEDKVKELKNIIDKFMNDDTDPKDDVKDEENKDKKEEE